MLSSYMSVFNISNVSKKSGVHRLKIWRWLTSRYANLTTEEKNNVVVAAESEVEEMEVNIFLAKAELKEIKKR